MYKGLQLRTVPELLQCVEYTYRHNRKYTIVVLTVLIEKSEHLHSLLFSDDEECRILGLMMLLGDLYDSLQEDYSWFLKHEVKNLKKDVTK
jgi:hypothetical protein